MTATQVYLGREIESVNFHQSTVLKLHWQFQRESKTLILSAQMRLLNRISQVGRMCNKVQAVLHNQTKILFNCLPG